MRFFQVSTLIAFMLLGGCATTAAHPDIKGGRGISYHLPEGKVRVTLTDAGGTISVLLAGPIMLPDPGYRMRSTVPHGAISDDDVTIAVDPKTNLLTSVKVTSTGRLSEILEQGLKGVLALEGSDETAGQVFFQKLYSLEELESTAAAEANTAIRGHFATACRLRPATELTEAEKKSCKTMALIGAERGSPVSFAVSPSPTIAVPVGRSDSALDVRPCLSGVCYRPLKPYMVTLTVANAFTQSDLLLFPDRSVVNSVPLASGVFAQQKYDLGFTEGVLTTLTQNSKSELVGLTLMPVKLLTAVLSAPGVALGLKKDASAAEASYLQTVASTAAQRQATREACKERPQDCTDTARRLIGGPVSQAADDGPAGDDGPMEED